MPTLKSISGRVGAGDGGGSLPELSVAVGEVPCDRDTGRSTRNGNTDVRWTSRDDRCGAVNGG